MKLVVLATTALAAVSLMACAPTLLVHAALPVTGIISSLALAGSSCSVAAVIR